MQDKMVETEPRGDRERGESLVCRDRLALKVCDKLVSLVHG